MIQRVQLKSWRSIAELDLELGPLTVIVGPNGSGKSNFIDALRFIRDVDEKGADRAVSDRHGIDSLEHWPKNTDRPMEVELSSGTHSLKFLSGQPLLSSDQKKKEELTSFEAYPIFPADLRLPQKPTSERRLTASADNFTSVFKELNEHFEERRDEILSIMELVLPGLKFIQIHQVGGFMTPTFQVENHEFNVSQISDGTLRVLGLVTALLQPHPPKTIALEEPELMVHPGLLPVLAETIVATSQEIQVIVTTHSPQFLDGFSPDVLFAAEMQNFVTTIAPISAHQKQAVRDRLFSMSEIMAMEGLHG